MADHGSDRAGGVYLPDLLTGRLTHGEIAELAALLGADVAPDGTLAELAFQLTDWARRRGELGALIEVAITRFPWLVFELRPFLRA